MNPYLIIASIGALLVSLLGGGAIGWHEEKIRVPAILEAQKTTDQTACEAAQQLTKDANDALQKDHDVIAAHLNALLVQHPAACVPVSGSANLPNGGFKYAGQNGSGLNTDWLRGYAAEAESYRREVIICTQFLTEERAAPQN